MDNDSLNDILKQKLPNLKDLLKEMDILKGCTLPGKDQVLVSDSTKRVVGSKNPIEIGLPPEVYPCIIPWDEDFDQYDGQCKHNWKEYHGFTESFEYCTKCDERRDIDDESTNT